MRFCWWLVLPLVLLATPLIAEQQPGPALPKEALPLGATARFGSLKWRMPGNVSDAAISLNGKLVAAIGGGALIVWDVATQRELYNFPAQQLHSGRVAFSPNGQFLAAVAAQTGVIHILNSETGQQKLQLDVPPAWHPQIAFSADGKKLVSGGSDGPTIVWDLARVKKLHEFPYPNVQFDSFALSPNNRWLAITEDRQALNIVDFETGRKHHRLQLPERFSGFSFSADNRTVAVILGKKLALYEVATGKLRLEFPTKPHAYSQLIPYGIKLAAIGKTIDWLDPLTGKLLGSWNGHRHSLTALAFSQDGGTAVSASYDGNVFVWDANVGKVIRAPIGLASTCDFLAFSPDDQSIVAGSADFHFLNTKTFEEQARIPLDENGRVTALSPDGKTVACAQYTQIVFIDVPTRKVVKTLQSLPWIPNTLAFGPDGKTIYGYGEMLWTKQSADNQIGWRRQIRVWNVAKGTEEKPFYKSADPTLPFGPAVSSEGKLVIADPDLRVWDLKTGKEEPRFEHQAMRLLFSHDGKILATDVLAREIKLLDITKRAVIREFDRFENEVWSWCFSHDDKILALGHDNGSFTLWSIPAGKKLADLPAHRGPVTALAFSQDGETLVTGSSDGTVLKWPAKAWRGK